MDYDKDGCFSGGAVEMPDGQHLLMYTGVRNVRRKNGKIDSFQTQCIAIGDGVNYEKYEANPVIRTEDIPEGGSVHDFRDPKIWREDGMYYMVVGNRTPDTSGSILYYPARMPFIGSFSTSWLPAITSTARCGNARTFSGWTTSTSC